MAGLSAKLCGKPDGADGFVWEILIDLNHLMWLVA